MGRTRRWAAALTVAVALTGPTACTSAPTPPAPPAHRTVAWTAVPLPGGVEPTTLTAAGGTLLVGAYAAGTSSTARLLRLAGDRFVPVPTEPRSYYARSARWRFVAADGTRIVAVGDASGGAHFNPRWTVWSGPASGTVVEQPQTTETFGGPGAGGLVGAAVEPGRGGVIVGGRAGAAGGVDIALWSPRGGTWVRATSTGTPPASTRTELRAARAVTAVPGGLVLAGSITRLGEGRVETAPALWRRTGDGDWRETTIAVTGVAQALALDCTPAECLVAGAVGERLALWTTDAEGAFQPQVVDAPLALGQQPVAVVNRTPGATLVAAASATASALLVGAGAGWQPVDPPPGAVRQLAQTGAAAYAISSDPAGRRTLWRADRAEFTGRSPTR